MRIIRNRKTGRGVCRIQPQKVNMFYILDLLREFSDSDHILTANDILELLAERYGVSTERRSIYRYINTLIYLGYDISVFDENGKGYYLRRRKMDDDELKRVIFSVYMSPLCGRGDAARAAEKLMEQQSVYKRRDYSRFIAENVYNARERAALLKKTDKLLYAAENGLEAEIGYTVFGFADGEPEEKTVPQMVIPQAVTASEGVLYLICLKQDREKLHHYRIDRISEIELGSAAGVAPTEERALREYADERIRGRGSERTVVRCSECVQDDLMETFGHAVHILTYKNKYFSAVIETSQSRMRSWAVNNLEYCEVIEPESLRKDIVAGIENNAYRRK